MRIINRILEELKDNPNHHNLTIIESLEDYFGKKMNYKAAFMRLGFKDPDRLMKTVPLEERNFIFVTIAKEISQAEKRLNNSQDDPIPVEEAPKKRTKKSYEKKNTNGTDL